MKAWAAASRPARIASRGVADDGAAAMPAERSWQSRVLTGGQDFTLVREVPEEGASRHAGALGDLRHRRGVVPLFSEQVDGGRDQSIHAPLVPIAPWGDTSDGTCVSSLCYRDGIVVPSLQGSFMRIFVTGRTGAKTRWGTPWNEAHMSRHN